MNNFLYVFIICIVLLAVIIAMTVIFMRSSDELKDDGYTDNEGRHLYYDRSRIKKEEFMKEHPGVDPREVRSVRRLFNFRRIFGGK